MPATEAVSVTDLMYVPTKKRHKGGEGGMQCVEILDLNFSLLEANILSFWEERSIRENMKMLLDAR